MVAAERKEVVVVFQAGPTGPYPVGEAGQRTQLEQPRAPGNPTQQGPLFTPN